MNELILTLIGFIFGSLIVYLILRPKLQQSQKLDNETIEQNKNIKAEFDKIIQERQDIIAEKEEVVREHSVLVAKRDEIMESIELLKQQANTVYESNLELAKEKLERAATALSKDYNKTKENLQQEYLDMLKDCANDFNVSINQKRVEIDDLNGKLRDLTEKVDAAVAANKRQEEMRTQQDFYRLQLSALDLEEIVKLREVAPYLRDSAPLNKVIWKVYYERPYTDLIGRVITNKTSSAIYKITDIESKKCYVGQAISPSERWRQHIKRGLGAEAPTKNKLYPAMQEKGVENFTFEIIEYCSKELLNEREDFWQEYFHAKDFGYSIK